MLYNSYTKISKLKSIKNKNKKPLQYRPNKRIRISNQRKIICLHSKLTLIQDLNIPSQIVELTFHSKPSTASTSSALDSLVSLLTFLKCLLNLNSK